MADDETQSSTPAREQGPSSSPRVSRGRSRRAGVSGGGTTPRTSERTPRTPRRASGAVAPTTSTRTRPQPDQNSDSSRETSPVFTPRVRARGGPSRFHHRRAPPPGRTPSPHSFSEREEEDFPDALLSPNKHPTPLKIEKYISPIKEEKKAKLLKEREERAKRKRERAQRQKQGLPPDASVIEIVSSDEEQHSPSRSPTRKRKRPDKQNSPNKKPRQDSNSPSKRLRAASIIVITSDDDAGPPATRPATPPPVSDMEDVLMMGGGTDVEGIGNMTFDETFPLDQNGEVVAAEQVPDNEPPSLNPGAAVNEGEPTKQLRDMEEVATALVVNGATKRTVSTGAADSASNESPVNDEQFGEVPDNESRIEDGRFFDEALASVARLELEDATSSTRPAVSNGPAPIQAPASLPGPGISPPAPSSPAVLTTRPPLTRTSAPHSRSTVAAPPPLLTASSPFASSASGPTLHPTPSGSGVRTQFRGGPLPYVYSKPWSVLGLFARGALGREGPQEVAGGAGVPNAHGYTPPVLSSSNDSTLGAMPPQRDEDPQKVVGATGDPNALEYTPSDDLMLGAIPPQRDEEPQKVAAGTDEPDALGYAPPSLSPDPTPPVLPPRHEEGPQKVAGATGDPNAFGYTPPPLSPTSDSTLGATPPVHSLALVVDGSILKQVEVCENSDDEDLRELDGLGYLSS
ncbi:hypothetical protein B0H19DRAFT_1106022 [Mycena capillaripes]|nr:hypothetical protein B0H19DRAFT_1106022 [Mycena capillaripes]